MEVALGYEDQCPQVGVDVQGEDRWSYGLGLKWVWRRAADGVPGELRWWSYHAADEEKEVDARVTGGLRWYENGGDDDGWVPPIVALRLILVLVDFSLGFPLKVACLVDISLILKLVIRR